LAQRKRVVAEAGIAEQNKIPAQMMLWELLTLQNKNVSKMLS